MIDAYKKTQDMPNAIIYVDYENVYLRLQDYGKNIIELDFVNKIKKYFAEKGINIIDFMVYADFDMEHFHKSFHQTYLQSLGISTKHVSFIGKNSSDIQLTVDVIRSLYKNEKVDFYIILSSDRDMIPLIQAINQEGKAAFLVTTKIGLQKGLLNFTEYHEYLENILDLKDEDLDINSNEGGPDHDYIEERDIEAAKDIVILLITSKIWQNYRKNNVPVNFEEYKKHISAARRLLPEEVDRLFKIAERIKWIELYTFRRNKKEIIGIKEGKRLTEILETSIKEAYNNKK